MYTPFDLRCSEANSSSPIPARKIARDAARANRAALAFQRGNQAMAEIVRALTPPIPSGSCADFGTSDVLKTPSPFPDGMLYRTRGGLSGVRGLGQGWYATYPTGSYGTILQPFQTDASSLIAAWGCTPDFTQATGIPAPPQSDSVAGMALPQGTKAGFSCGWWCWILLGLGIVALSKEGKKTVQHYRRRKAR